MPFATLSDEAIALVISSKIGLAIIQLIRDEVFRCEKRSLNYSQMAISEEDWRAAEMSVFVSIFWVFWDDV